MYVIVDWQNEEDITTIKRDGETVRCHRIEDITSLLTEECNKTGNIYLKIVEI